MFTIINGKLVRITQPMLSADTGSGGTGGTETQTSGTNTQTNETNTQQQQQGQIQGSNEQTNTNTQQQNSTGTEKTFTQSDVSAIAAKEAKKAQEKILKDLGVSDFKTAKEGLKKFLEQQEAEKTEAQKANERANTFEQELNNANSTIETLTAQLAALKLGVKADSLEDAITLAKSMVNEDITIDDALTKVLEKYPSFKSSIEENKDKEEVKKPKFSEGEHKSDVNVTEEQLWAEAFKFPI